MVVIENTRPKVLLVNDRTDNLSVLIDMLDPLELDIYIAVSIENIYDSVESNDFDLILLDVIMPEVESYKVCQRLKNNSKYKDIPFIFVSPLIAYEDKIKAFESGCDDYVAKPLLQNELVARVKLHLQKGKLFKSLKNLLRRSYHELYNPLSIINTSLELQNIKYGSNKYSNAIAVASKTLQVVYDDLYYSLTPKYVDKNISSIDLSDFLQKRIDYFYYLRKSKNIEIKLKYKDSSFIKIEESDLQRIVDNTLSNAIKYANRSSIINIEIINDKNFIIFETTNRGSIINNPDKIFNIGYRENFEQIGMGIGLEIVASICSLHNIKAEVFSTDGSTSFRYSIQKESP